MKPTLVILAAGMGSRYGGLKQIDSFGPSGETIIEYSIYDAINAGFGKVVFIIRKSFEDDFRAKFNPIFEDRIEIAYVFQEFNDPEISEVYWKEREKPWGTAHAVLAARNAVDTPFAVINADDYYGQTSFKIIADFLENDCTEGLWALVGYRLGNTLSDHGTVNRGIVSTNENNELVDINERLKIKKDNGAVTYLEGDDRHPLSEDDIASMNFFGFHPTIFKHFEEHFLEFVEENYSNPTAEFFIPLGLSRLIKNDTITMQILPCPDHWHGVTHRDDKPILEAAFQKLVDDGKYPPDLWSEN